MRLIDADALREALRDMYPEYRGKPAFCDGLYAAVETLDAAPTVCCAECVRCDVCDIHDQATPSDDFGCSYFERKR